MQREKGICVILEKIRSFSDKWVRMGGKIKTYEGSLQKVKNLPLNHK
jgi:hypothetical protein